MPQGLIVKQGYLVKESISLSVFSFSKNRLNIVKTNKELFDKNKQTRAFMPNLIHSLDAASMTLLEKKKSFHKARDSNVNLYTVQDCFATTANNVPLLLNTLKDVYITLYKYCKYMQKFDSNFIEYIFDQYGDDTTWSPKDRSLEVGKHRFVIPKIENIYHNLAVRDAIYHIN